MINVKCNPGKGFSISLQIFYLKHFLFFGALLISGFIKAQKVENIYVNLYTDSLKKGTYNYINIDGKLTNGKYIPLDSTEIIFTASEGKFAGNSLWLEPDFRKDKVTIKAVLRSNPATYKEFTMYVKKKPNDEKLKTLDELMNESDANSKPAKRKKNL